MAFAIPLQFGLQQQTLPDAAVPSIDICLPGFPQS
jgi:hypothetical protein